jgi:hypothetical protein
MRSIIKSLVLLIEKNEIEPLFESAIGQFGRENLRHFGGEILSWLRSDLFIPRKKTIRYPNRPHWFNDFSSFIQNTNDLNELFSCGNYSIDFRQEISFDERMEIHQYVSANYKPHLFVTYR